MPDQIIDVAGPKAGLGPLLAEMSTTVPAFRRAYLGFLRYLDDLNTRLAAAGGGPFRMSASNPGQPYYARAIEALGGMGKVVVKSNQIGVTADSLMDTARRFAAEAIAAEGEASGAAGPAPLVDLLALAEIAAVANRVIPADYEREWRRRHPEIRPAPETPPAGIPRSYWDGVRLSLAYMYHAGALPWLNAESENQLAAFDTDHFFSHAWLVQVRSVAECSRGTRRTGAAILVAADGPDGGGPGAGRVRAGGLGLRGGERGDQGRPHRTDAARVPAGTASHDRGRGRPGDLSLRRSRPRPPRGTPRRAVRRRAGGVGASASSERRRPAPAHHRSAVARLRASVTLRAPVPASPSVPPPCRCRARHRGGATGRPRPRTEAWLRTELAIGHCSTRASRRPSPACRPRATRGRSLPGAPARWRRRARSPAGAS